MDHFNAPLKHSSETWENYAKSQTWHHIFGVSLEPGPYWISSTSRHSISSRRQARWNVSNVGMR